MSQLNTEREALKTKIVEANIGLAADDIVVERQADIWRSIAMRMSQAENGVVLTIGTAEGRRQDPEESDLDFLITQTLTLIVQPVLHPNQIPEEAIWEAMVKLVDGLAITAGQHSYYHYRVEGFGEVELPRNYLGRQTIVRKRLTIL